MNFIDKLSQKMGQLNYLKANYRIQIVFLVMKLNLGYNQNRKNPSITQEERQTVPSINLHNLSAGKHEGTKQLEGKSPEKINTYQNRVETKGKPKYDGKSNEFTKLKKQYNTIMTEAKIRKAYSPSCVEQQHSEDLSVEAKHCEKIISPHGAKKQSCKLKTKEQFHDKKKSNGIISEHDKKPSWLHRKTKNEPSLPQGKNSFGKYDNQKSRENKPEKSPKYFNLKNHNKSSTRINMHNTLSSTTQDLYCSKSQNLAKQWKKSSQNMMKSKKTDDQHLKHSKSEDPEFQFGLEVQLSPEMNKIMFQREVNQMKRQLENALEDKNILINRIETLETQLGSSNRKLQEWKQIQMTHKAAQKALKETISELEEKLASSRELKNMQLNSQIAKFHGESSFEKQILAKKNEEISRLNEVIINNRNKVQKAYQELSSQKLKLAKQKQVMQQKYQAIIASKDKQLERINGEVEVLREDMEKLRRELSLKGNQFHKISLELQSKNKMINTQTCKEEDSTHMHSFMEKHIEGELTGGALMRRSSDHPKSRGEIPTSKQI